MTTNNKDYLDEYIYNFIDDLCKSSNKYKELSANLKERISELFESIEDDDCKEIISDIEELNKYLETIYNISTNELTSIKNNGKKLIEKYMKHKKKILSFKTKINVLEGELSNINEQKEKALLKIDELSDEYYKLYQEKNKLEMNNTVKEDEKKEKDELNKELLNEEIKELNEKNEYLKKEIISYEKKIKDLEKKNNEIFEMNSQLKQELEYKDKTLEIWIEKNSKLDEENKNVIFMNRGLQKTIEIFENQFKENDIIIKQLKEQINHYEQLNNEKNINLNSLINDEEDKEDNSDDLSDENENEVNKKRRYAVDYNGMGINLNELINDESESSEYVTNYKKGQFNKNKIGVKSPIFKYKKINNDILSFNQFASPKKNLNKGFDSNFLNKRTASNILIKLQNYRNENKDNNKPKLSKNDETFLSELLFRLIDC